jgi:hypothetical protein
MSLLRVSASEESSSTGSIVPASGKLERWPGNNGLEPSQFTRKLSLETKSAGILHFVQNDIGGLNEPWLAYGAISDYSTCAIDQPQRHRGVVAALIFVGMVASLCHAKWNSNCTA